MPDERLPSIASQIVDELRKVVHDHAITEDELHEAADFLNEIGRAGLFRSLLDIAFAMTIIDRKRANNPGTRPSLEGPEYVAGAPERPGGSLLETEPGPGAALLSISGVVRESVTGRPIPGAEIDLWHADEQGGYGRDGFHLRGVVRTGNDGSYLVRTIVPQDYAEHEDDLIGELLGRLGRQNYRPAHIHVKIRVDGEERLTTQLYRSDSRYLETDYVVGAVTSDGIMALKASTPLRGRPCFEASYDFELPESSAT